MIVHFSVRLRSLALGVFVLAGCSRHDHGVSVNPSMGYFTPAERFLNDRGFAAAPGSAGDVLSMERVHADSVDRIRLFRGGGSPASMNFYSGSVGSGGSGVYPAGLNRGVYQGGGYSMTASGYSPASGPSGLLTAVLTTYTVDAKGVRYAVEPATTTLWQLDSLLDIVERVQKPKR